MGIKNLKLYKRLNSFFHSNEVLNVFTQEYRQNVIYREMMMQNIELFKFDSDNYDVEERIKILKINHKNNFEINKEAN